VNYLQIPESISRGITLITSENTPCNMQRKRYEHIFHKGYEVPMTHANGGIVNTVSVKSVRTAKYKLHEGCQVNQSSANLFSN
jgi:hypothetical protein